MPVHNPWPPAWNLAYCRFTWNANTEKESPFGTWNLLLAKPSVLRLRRFSLSRPRLPPEVMMDNRENAQRAKAWNAWDTVLSADGRGMDEEL